MSRETKDLKNYLTILSSDGSFRQSVPEGTPGSVVREYEMSDGTKGSKNELVLKAITGKITNVEFVDASFGKLIQVTVTDEEGDLTISTGTSNNFGIDLMKKLPSLDFTKEYRFAPYSFDDDKGRSQKGISINPAGDKDTKIKSYFYDGEKNLNGFPEPKGDTSKYTKNKWKSYFGEVEDFLVEYTEANIVTQVKDIPQDDSDATAEDVDY